MNYGFNCGIWGNLFGVPNVVADRYLKLSTEVQIKVIIYLLRNNGRTFSISEIAKTLGFSEDEVSDAVIYWQQANILPTEDNLNINSLNNNMFSAPSEIPVSENVIYTENRTYSSAGLNLKPSDIADIMQSSKELQELFAVVENQLGVMNFAIQRSVIWMYQYLGLPFDVIVTLIGYCVSENKTGVSEIDRIANIWSKNKIDTHELAQAEVNRMKETQELSSFIAKIKRIFKMGRDPVGELNNLMVKWKNEKYPDELLRFAYEKAVESTGYPVRLPIEYIDKILTSWKEKGITTLEDAQKLTLDFKAEFKKNKQGNSETEDEYAIFLNDF